jgi:hypothetical protein
VNLIANIAKGSPKPLAWDKGGAAVVTGWANAMRKQKNGK